MFLYVVKYVRRFVNLFVDSWVVFVNSKCGYKKFFYFQIGLWDIYMFVWFVIIYEFLIKEEYGRLLEVKQEEIIKQIFGYFVWLLDYMKFGVYKQFDMDQEQLKILFECLQIVKKVEFLCGIQF